MKEKPVMTPEFWAELAAIERYGLRTIAADVESWFDEVWPQYRERRYKLHARAIRSWYSRAYEDDVLSAIKRRETLSTREDVERLEEWARSRQPGEFAAGDAPIDYFSKLK